MRLFSQTDVDLCSQTGSLMFFFQSCTEDKIIRFKKAVEYYSVASKPQHLPLQLGGFLSNLTTLLLWLSSTAERGGGLGLGVHEAGFVFGRTHLRLFNTSNLNKIKDGALKC